MGMRAENDLDDAVRKLVEFVGQLDLNALVDFERCQLRESGGAELPKAVRDAIDLRRHELLA
jgi:hypothetical protein